MTVRGRYAPSPTGELHLGNASTALLAWLSVRSRDGTFVMRMEDLDRPRVRPGAADRILDDLAWLGIDWDEGPGLGGPHGPYEQSARTVDYDRAFERLRADGRLYPCFCSRRDIRAAASAPQHPGDEVRYPGTCRRLDPSEVERRLREGRQHAWRFRVDPDDRLAFHDAVHGMRGDDGEPPPGDFVVRRYDGSSAYHLAVVVDDAAMAIDEVVRGDDLLPSTSRQIALYRALDLAPPRFGHVPLLLGPDGVRLSKRHRGTSLREVRGAGWSSERTVALLARVVGLPVNGDRTRPADLLDGFTLERIPRADGGVRLDGAKLPGGERAAG